MERRAGNAMTEFAILLPVYVLLLIGLVFFANEILFWQEGQLAARFLATNTRSGPPPPPPGTQSPLMAVTTGSLVPQDYFIFGTMQGQPQISLGNQPGIFSQADIREELVQAAWRVSQSFDVGGNMTQDQSLTKEGNVVYGNKRNLFQAIPGQYSFDGDDTLIAEELSDWFNRCSATVTLTYDSKFLHVGKWTLPPASVTGRAEAVVREAANKQRSLTTSRSGYRKPIEDLIARFGPDEVSAGDLAMPDYPDFGGSDPFWVPN